MLRDHEKDREPISIHALREEGDHGRLPATGKDSYFYPRPPRGGRHLVVGHLIHGGVFLSTPSARRATFPVPQPDSRTRISIHALREEGDATAAPTAKSSRTFLSTPSARRATA